MSELNEGNKVTRPTHAALKKKHGEDERDWPQIGTATIDRNGSALIYIHKIPDDQVSVALRPLEELIQLRAQRSEKASQHLLDEKRSIKL